MGTIADLLNTAMRDFVRFTGDGLPNEPVGRPLPVGDPASGEFNPPKKQVRDAFRAKEWKAFGKEIATPVHGAIAIKSRSGGGHVAFVVGKSSDGKALYMLGGNQSDSVNIARYDKSVWEKFVVPNDFDETTATLPIYSKSAASAGSET